MIGWGEGLHQENGHKEIRSGEPVFEAGNADFPMGADDNHTA